MAQCTRGANDAKVLGYKGTWGVMVQGRRDARVPGVHNITIALQAESTIHERKCYIKLGYEL